MAWETRDLSAGTDGWRVSIRQGYEVFCGSSELAECVGGLFLGREGRRAVRRKLYDGFELTVRTGQIVAVVGPSGAGKSVLLREVAGKIDDAVAVNRTGGPRQAPDRAAIDGIAPVRECVLGELGQRLDLLARCGLAEAAVMITPERYLSGGEAFRLSLARALWRAQRRWERFRRPTLLVADEFASSLDTLTAAALCRQIRSLVSRWPVGLLLATPRVELLDALRPEKIVVKPLNRPAQELVGPLRDGAANRSKKRAAKARARGGRLADPRRWPIRRGKIRENHALAGFHYIAGPPAAHKRVYVIRSPRHVSRWGGPDVAAVLVVSPPLMNCRARNVATAGRYGRRRAGRRKAARLLNAEVESISRVVVHPQVRGLGLSVRLVRHALRNAEKPVVEGMDRRTCPGRRPGPHAHEAHVKSP